MAHKLHLSHPSIAVARVPPGVAGLALAAEGVVHLGGGLVVWCPRALAELVNVEVLLEVVEAVLEALAAALGRAGVGFWRAANAVSAGWLLVSEESVSEWAGTYALWCLFRCSLF